MKKLLMIACLGLVFACTNEGKEEQSEENLSEESAVVTESSESAESIAKEEAAEAKTLEIEAAVDEIEKENKSIEDDLNAILNQ